MLTGPGCANEIPRNSGKTSGYSQTHSLDIFQELFSMLLKVDNVRAASNENQSPQVLIN